MINVKKSQPPPPCLEKEKKKKNGDYKCGEVMEKLKKDFFNKCYLCEYKSPVTINVEHFQAHQGDINLKFDWNNLFWSCGHCNNTKLHLYPSILNCTNPDHRVEEWIRYHILPYPKARAEIRPLVQEEKVQNTVKLLDAIFNGKTATGAKLKTHEAENLRKKLLHEIRIFQDNLIEYFEEDLEEKEKQLILKKIKRELKPSSAFTAFKRWIVRSTPGLMKEFGQFLPTAHSDMGQ